MVTSQNGYSANDRSQIETYQIGGKTKVALRKGAPGWLLQHLGNWFDANIRDIDPGILDDWGYAERPIRGGVELSNHASGTALDVDATKWPLGVEPTAYLTKTEIARLKQHLTIYEGAIRWGGDYAGRKDPMHFEIDKPEAFCERIQAKLLGTIPTEDLETVMADVASLKFVTSPRNTNAWWLTDGMTKRPVVAGEPELLMQLGLAEKHRTDTDPEQTVAVIPDDMLDRIPVAPSA